MLLEAASFILNSKYSKTFLTKEIFLHLLLPLYIETPSFKKKNVPIIREFFAKHDDDVHVLKRIL